MCVKYTKVGQIVESFAQLFYFCIDFNVGTSLFWRWVYG